jgi:hypothetical protein
MSKMCPLMVLNNVPSIATNCPAKVSARPPLTRSLRELGVRNLELIRPTWRSSVRQGPLSQRTRARIRLKLAVVIACHPEFVYKAKELLNARIGLLLSPRTVQ